MFCVCALSAVLEAFGVGNVHVVLIDGWYLFFACALVDVISGVLCRVHCVLCWVCLVDVLLHCGGVN